MARFKDFGSPSTDNEREPITFKIYDEEFECYPELPGKTLLEFVKMSNSEDPTASAEAIDAFFEKALLPESYERFDILANDPERIITVATLAEIVQWIVEEQSARPTTGPEVLPSGV